MATGPIDYTGLQPKEDFTRDIASGLQLSAAFQQIQAQKQAQEQAVLAQQQAQAAQQQYQSDVLAAMNNPTPQNFAGLALKYPAQREAIKQSWETQSEGERKAQGDAASQAYSALLAGKPDIAKQVVQTRIDALKNAGQDTSAESNILSILQSNPQQAQAALGFTLAHIGDPKAFATQFGSLQQEGRAAQAAPDQLAKTQEEILTAQQKRRLAEFDAQIASADSETKRGQLQLERDKFVAEQGQKVQAQGQDVQSKIDSVQQALDVTKELIKDPLLESSFGVGSTIGKFLGQIPGTENLGFRAKVQTLKSQLFIPAVAAFKAAGGAGALSDAEGKKLDAAIASLDTDLKPEQFKNSLGVAQRYLEKGFKALVANQKLPTTGGGYVATVPGVGTVNEGDINRLLKARPGATREQVIQYIQSLQKAQ